MKSYNLEAFGHITSAKELVSNEIVTGELPSIEQVKKLATWTDDMAELFDREPSWFEQEQDGRKQDRSGALARLAYSGAEQNWSDEQIMAALLDADSRWGKYVGRRNRNRLLIDLINRARQKHGYRPVTDIDFGSLLKGSASGDDEPKLVYSFSEFLDADFHIDWMLMELFAVGGFGLITGYPGVGKTTLAIQLAAHLACGRKSWLHWPNADGQKKVLFLSLEMGPNPLHLFMSTIAPEYEDDEEAMRRNFHIVPLGNPVGLDTPAGQEFLDNLLTEYMPDVLVVDSLQAALSKELTDEQAVKSFMAYLAKVRTRYNTAILMVHHNRKKSSDQQMTGVEISDIYGSQFIAAAVDFVLTLNSLSQDVVNVTHVKNRLGPTLEAFEIARNKNLTFSLDFEHVRDNFPTRERPGIDPEGPLAI